MKKLSLLGLICIYQISTAQITDSSRFYFEKGIDAQKKNNLPLASQHFQKSLSFNSENKSVLLAQSFLAKEMHKLSLSQQFFEKSNQLDPNNPIILEELANIYFNNHQLNKAKEFAESCPNCKSHNRILGMCYYESEDYVKAEKYLNLALRENPSDINISYTLARTYVNMEQYNKAMTYYDAVVKMPEVRPMWIYEQGIMYYENSDYKNALIAFNKAVEHGYTPGNDYNENYAFASIYCGDYTKGENLIMELWQKNPVKKDIVRSLITTLYEKKQYDRAIFYCEKLMQLDEKDSKTLYQAGLCFQKKGMKEKGDNLCDKAIELDPSLESLRTKRDISIL